MVPVLLLVALAVFFIFQLLPGDAAVMGLGDDATPETVAALRHQMGLDRPAAVRFVEWLSRAAQGDFGLSLRSTHEPVGPLLGAKLWITAQLALASLAIGLALGVPLGIAAALRRDGLLDLVVRTAGMVGYSMPRYWLAILLVLLFSLQLAWLPPAGYLVPGDSLGELPRYLLLPALSLGLPLAAVVMRFLRSGLLDVLSQDYVRTARAKGLGERTVIVRHALRNGLLPLVTVVGLHMGHLLGGAVIVEQVFSWPGIGWLMVESIHQRDLPVVQGAILVSAVIFMAINLLVDFSYAVLDPRIRLQRRR